MKLTIFESAYSSSKFPISPFKDKTFVFVTVDLNFEDIQTYMEEEYVLNRPYNIKEPTRLRRLKTSLKPYMEKEFEYLIIDLDKIYSEFSLKKITEWFIEKDYYVRMFPSRGFNGNTKFTQKAIIKARGNNNKESILNILLELKEGLKDFCEVDISSLNEGAFQAPTRKTGTTLVWYGKYIPNSFLLEKKQIKTTCDSSLIESSVLDVCLNYYSELGYSIIERKDELIRFSHHNEKTRGGFFMFKNNPFLMHHFNPDRNFNIFSKVKDKKAVQNYLEEYNKQKRKNILGGCGEYKDSVTLNKKYLDKKDTIKFVDKFIDSGGTLKIKSPMGTGKSNIIKNIIEKSQNKLMPVLIITNRITIANDFKEKYSLKIYTDFDYKPGDSLIVQLESLHKFNLKYFDIIIIDEFLSLMLHSKNTMSEYSKLNVAKLKYSLNKKHLVIADAFLNGTEDNFILPEPKFLIENKYRDDIDVSFIDDTNKFLGAVISTARVEKGKRPITVSCSSKLIAKALNLEATKHGLNLVQLNSESSEEDRKIIFDAFKLKTPPWDILVYTPVLTVGVSILNNIKYHFHYDESNSMDVVSSIQMTRRSRKAKFLICCVHERKRYLQTNKDIFENEINENIKKHYNNKLSFLIEIDEHGEPRISPVGKFINTVELTYNLLESNHRESFFILMDHQFLHKPYKLKNIEDILIKSHRKSDIINSVNINKLKKEIKEQEQQEILFALQNLDEISYDQNILDDIKNRTHIVNIEDKIIKLLSTIKPHFKEDISNEDLQKLAEREIKTNFNYISKLKKLKLFLTTTPQKVQNILGHIISENITNKKQIEFFEYLLKIKLKNIELKRTFSKKEIQEIDKKIKYGSFLPFIQKLGFRKSGSLYMITDKLINDIKFLK